jgi:hypothetical protein
VLRAFGRALVAVGKVVHGLTGRTRKMRKQREFCPAPVEGLERRIALSGIGAVRPVARAKLVLAAHTNATQAIVNQTNLAFDSFTTDYLQAQGAYLSDSMVKGSHGAFKNFVTQRVELLAAQLTRIMAHVPGSLKRLQTSSSGGPVVIQVFLRTRINGNSGSSLISALRGSGGGNGAIPPIGTTGPATTLYTDQAISAIETARTATLNSIGFLYGKAFDKHR